MSLTLINSPGLATSNAYSSLSTCALYISENIHITATWSSLSTINQTACIIYATSLIDEQMDWIGTKNSTTQSLDWPRDNVVDKNDEDVTSTDIPIDIQRGTSFMAYFLSQDDRTSDSDTFGFKSIKAGSLAMVIDKYDRTPTMPNSVWQMLLPYGTKMASLPRTLERK